MYKTASRNLSRVSMNTVMGKGGGDRAAPTLSTNESARLTERRRIARIRRIFQIEQQIQAAISKGVSTAVLKAELAGVRSGAIDVPMSLGRDPRPKKHGVPSVIVARRDGPERELVGSSPARRQPPVSVKAIETDLTDLAKGKITLSGVSVVKTLLETFSASDISEILKAPLKVIQKVSVSHLLSIAPLLENEAGMVLVGILEGRLSDIYGVEEPSGPSSCGSSV